MQPYFFPYIGYFSIIENTDKFIFFDTPQYIHHGWVNRNRVLNSKNEVSYITVPIKKAEQTMPIMNIEIDNSKKWKEKIWGLLTVYKKKAPYYNLVLELLHNILDREYLKLSDLNIVSTQNVCDYLGISTSLDVFSKMNMPLPEIKKPDEWALYITEKEGYSTYVNPPGGKDFFVREKYSNKNIELEFLQINFNEYIQKIGRFEKGLSIIDVMMFCSKSEIMDMLHDYEIIN